MHYDVEKAQMGIVYIDEIDKISQSRQSLSPVTYRERACSRRCLNSRGHHCLGATKGGRKHPQQEFLQVDTSNILFICGGAFAGLDKVIQNRSDKGGIGFSADVKAQADKKDFAESLVDLDEIWCSTG